MILRKEEVMTLLLEIRTELTNVGSKLNMDFLDSAVANVSKAESPEFNMALVLCSLFTKCEANTVDRIKLFIKRSEDIDEKNY